MKVGKTDTPHKRQIKMTTELFTYIETLDPQTMVQFLTKAECMFAQVFWMTTTSVDLYAGYEKSGTIKISEEGVAGMVTGVELFKILYKLPEFRAMLRGTTFVSDLKSEEVY